MSTTDASSPLWAICQQRTCSIAALGEHLEWYADAGEYCPECGSVLTRLSINDAPVPADVVFIAATEPLPETRIDPLVSSIEVDARTKMAPLAIVPSVVRTNAKRPIWLRILATVRTKVGLDSTTRRRHPEHPLWIQILAVVLVCVLVGGFSYVIAVNAGPPPGSVSVCPLARMPQLASDLIGGYVRDKHLDATNYTVAAPATCDLQITEAPGTGAPPVALDAVVPVVNEQNPIKVLSEEQLRNIFSGQIRDWSQLGGEPGAIVRIMPAAETDEAKILTGTLLFGAALDQYVQRAPTSVDVMRDVAGNAGRNAIGFVALSQATSANIVSLKYFPPVNAVSVGEYRFPYMLVIAAEARSAKAQALAQQLSQYAQSAAGNAIVTRDGFVGARYHELSATNKAGL